jgi:hypothetical protein
MKTKIYQSFDAVPKNAVALFESAELDSFYFGHSWFKNYADHIPAAADQVRVYVVSDENGEDVLAVAPFMVKDKKTQNAGNELESLSNYYSSLYSFAFKNEPSKLTASLLTLFQSVMDERPHFSTLSLRPLDNTSPAYGACVAALKASGFVVQEYFCFGNWTLDVGGRSFEEYFKSLPSQTRNTVQRKEKQLFKREGVVLRIVTESQDVDAAMDQYEIVYRSSWKDDEPYAGFMRGLVREAARRSWLRLGVVTIDGEPAAAQIWITCNGIASIYKLAYDEKFGQLSVGSVLTKALMQRAIDVDKVHEIDYLTGDDAYKRDWMSRRRERWGLLAMNPKTLRGQWLIARYLAGKVFKRVRGLFKKKAA